MRVNSLRILAHIVLYQSPTVAKLAIESLFEQQREGIDLHILVSDNASNDGLIDKLEEHFGTRVRFQRNQENIGFAAAQNFAAAILLQEEFDYLFLLNPDCRLQYDALIKLVNALERESSSGLATPLLYRANEDLTPLVPAQIDAAGMEMNSSLRHFDREKWDPNADLSIQHVFGGTGAALMIKRACIESLLIDTKASNEGLYRVYPQLKSDNALRAPLFDEAFFAFREDADLAWRSQLFGWDTIFIPDAIGYHVRHVLPERRSQLSWEINSWSVRNRFLMQINNFSFAGMWHCVIPGLILRNMLVLLGVLMREWSSLRGLREIFILLPRAIARRREILRRARCNRRRIGGWFVASH